VPPSSSSLPHKLYPSLEPLQPQLKFPDKLQESKEPAQPKSDLDRKIEQNITKRCIRCHQYYTEAAIAKDENKTPCKFHPGIFARGYTSPLLSGAAIQYWSCCKATSRTEPGCRATQHKEDPQMSKVQQNFSNENQANIGKLIDAPFTLGAVEQKDDTKEEEKEKLKKPEKVSNAICHYVTEADTLIGLSFRYGIPAKSIRQLNHMPTNDIQAFSRLYIPKKGIDITTIEIHSDDEDVAPPTDMSAAERALFEKRMLQRLRGQTGMSLEEAKYYLSLYGFSFVEALKEYDEDVEFEKTHVYVPAKICK